MIHYECEKALFSEDLTVDDLPDFWNEKMSSYLGIDITNDAQGAARCTLVCWPVWVFPSYTLGTLIAAELHERLTRHIENLDASSIWNLYAH